MLFYNTVHSWRSSSSSCFNLQRVQSRQVLMYHNASYVYLTAAAVQGYLELLPQPTGNKQQRVQWTQAIMYHHMSHVCLTTVAVQRLLKLLLQPTGNRGWCSQDRHLRTTRRIRVHLEAVGPTSSGTESLALVQVAYTLTFQ